VLLKGVVHSFPEICVEFGTQLGNMVCSMSDVLK